MALRKRVASSLGLAALLGVVCAGAHADTQFGSAVTTSGVFDWNGSSFGSGATGAGSSLGTQFTFLVDTKVYQAGKTVDATLALTGFASGQAASAGGSVLQDLKNVTETLTANGSGKTLVSLKGPTNGVLYGSGKNLTFYIQGNDLFTSDYLKLGGRQSQTITFTTDSLLNVKTGVGSPYGTLSSFTAIAKSDVFTSSSVPEASSLLGLGGLVLGGGLVGLRRRRA